jgi:hypothetical protein
MRCISCLTGRNWECSRDEQCNDQLVNSGSESDSIPGSVGLHELVLEASIGEGRQDVRRDSESDSDPSSTPKVPVREVNTYKDDSALRDQQSTGRKRAAVMYPLDSEADCEWARQFNCGGNKAIVGCIDGKQEARHHGPNKNTLDNDAGNVHRICHKCHNRWHATNDEGYVWGGLYEPHNPREATYDELVASERKWQGIKLKKVVD